MTATNKILILFCFWCVFELPAREKVIFLDDPVTSLQQRIFMMRGAAKTLDVAMYIYGNDEVSAQTLLEIHNAARRGVKIRFIIDDLNNWVPSEILSFLASEGVSIRFFNRFQLKHPMDNLVRMHTKLTIADHRRYILGGRNIDNTYFYIGDQTNFRDREIYIEGPSAIEARKAFEDLWFCSLLSARKNISSGYKNKSGSDVMAYFNNLRTVPMLMDYKLNQHLGRVQKFYCDEVKIIADKIHSARYQEKKTTTYIIKLIDQAEKEILIESPYIVFSQDIYDAFQRAVDRGVNVQILTNSMNTSDSYFVLPVYFKERDQLIKLGFDIMEFQGEQQYLHSKMFIFDRKHLVIGSYNLDNFSTKINTEIYVHIQNADIVRESIRLYRKTYLLSKRPAPDQWYPTLFEQNMELQSMSKYIVIKILQHTIAPYMRNYL